MKRIPAVIALTAALSFGVSAHAQTSFADVPAGHWAQEAIKRAVDCGIILGYPDGTFRGKQAITRYEAAAMIGRLLDAIATGKCGLNTGQPGSLDADALEALQNAVQELSADLADQGVRISELEDNAVTQDDLSRVEELATEARDLAQAAVDNAGGEGGASADDIAALQEQLDALQEQADNAVSADDFAALQDQVAAVEELAQEARDLAEANTGSGDGTDPEALAALTDQVEAAGIAADTALAQSRDLQDSVDALSGRVDDLESQLGDLGATVEGQADSIAALNDLVVLLNQDVLSLQDRVSALEGQIEDVNAQFEDINAQLEQTASADDLEALREFTTLLRRDQTALADRVSDLEARVGAAEKKNADQDARLDVLEANTFTISGSIGLNYYVSRTWLSGLGNVSGPNFDIDRLGFDNAFSSGQDSDKDQAKTQYTDFGDSGLGDTGKNDALGRRVNGNGIVPGSDGNKEGGIGTSFSIKLALKPRALTEDGKGYPTSPNTVSITITGSNGGDFKGGTGDSIDPIAFKLTSLSTKFTVGAQPLTIAYGIKPGFKFTNYAFNNGGGRGDGFVATAELPFFGLKLTGVYGSKSGDAFGPAAAIPGATVAPTITGGKVSFPVGLAAKSKVVITFLSGDTVERVVDAGTTSFDFIVPDNASIGQVANPATPAVPATISGIASITAAPLTNSRAGNNGDFIYYRGVKGSASIIDGLEGGVFWANQQDDILKVQGPATSVFGGYVTGKAFGFLSLDGEYSVSSVDGVTPAIAANKNAFYIKAGLNFGIVNIGANYRSIGNDFSALGGDGDYVYATNQTGFGVDASVALGFITVGGYFDSRSSVDNTANLGNGPKADTQNTIITTANGTPSGTRATSATNFGVGAFLRLIGFDIGGGFISITETGTGVTTANDKTVLGVKLVHDGAKDGKLIAGLNLAAGYASITTGTAAAVTGIYAYGEYVGDFGGFKITPKAYFGSGGTASVLGFGATASIPLFGAKLTAGGAIDTYTDTAAAAAPAKGGTTWASVGLAFEQFLLPNSNFSVNFAYRADTNRKGTKFGPAWGDVNGISTASSSFDLRDAFLKGWGSNAAGAGQTELGLYLSYGYYGLQFNYGVFQITPKSADATTTAADVIVGQAFSIGYKLKF
jgi:predicted  nucleic acid-binding Zn-ribbon protein